MLSRGKEFCIGRMKVILTMKRCIAALAVLVGVVLLWAVLPVTASDGKDLWLFFLIDCIVALSLGIQIKLPWNLSFGKFYTAGILFVAPAVCFFCTEHLVGNSIWNLKLVVLLLNYGLYLIPFLLLYSITNRIRITVVFGTLLCGGYAILNSFVKSFRGSVISAADFYAVRSALGVSGNYHFDFDEGKAKVLLLLLCIILLTLHCRYREKRRSVRLVRLGGLAVLVVLLYSLLSSDSFLEANDLNMSDWNPDGKASYYGSLLQIATGISDLSVKEPFEYSSEEAREIMETGATNASDSFLAETSLDGEMPDIIVIMNESFSDLSILGEFETDTDYLSNLSALEGNVIKGNLSVPVLGGNTANSEFEFLTGCSCAFLSEDCVPYTSLIREGTYNLGQELEEKGYHSIFMHGMEGQIWNRSTVYSLFGFDDSYFVEEYTNPEYYGNNISDRSNYQELISRYEEAKEEEHLFLFNVTIQNHSGYQLSDFTQTVHILGEKDYEEAQTYLSMVKESDQAFQELLDYFSNCEKPVLICMFGDHQPVTTDGFVEDLLAETSTSGLEGQAKRYQTPFVIWANYEMESKVYENVSVNYLSSILLGAANLELDDYQKFLSSVYEEYPVVSAHGVMDQEGNWYSFQEAGQSELLNNYWKVEYWKLFDSDS